MVYPEDYGQGKTREFRHSAISVAVVSMVMIAAASSTLLFFA